MPSKLTQHELRQHALQALFTLSVRPEMSMTDAINYALDYESVANPDFLTHLVQGVVTTAPVLDGEISKHLTADWQLERLTNIDRSILRLAAYELTQMDTPPKVAVDEAINLAHDFSDEAAAKLINGVLNQMVEKK